jgi:hypothetical protein
VTDQGPTAARLQYLAQVLANPPASRQPCAADCGQPLTQWHVDAEGRHWHPECLPAGTAMPVSAEKRIRQLEAQLAESRAEIEHLHQAHLNQPVLRQCTYPGCLREFDMNGTLTGKHLRPSWSGEGWLQVRAVNGHICPDHAHIVAADAHRPHWNARTETTPATLACSCGWTSPPARWRGYGTEAWKDHLLIAAETAP